MNTDRSRGAALAAQSPAETEPPAEPGAPAPADDEPPPAGSAQDQILARVALGELSPEVAASLLG